MEDDSSTPIESVMEVEKEHADEANAALAELSGISSGNSDDGGGRREPAPMYSGEPMEPEESEVDFWIQLSLTFVTVSVMVFVLFIPKVRQLLEPMIGTGYVALIIRSLAIGLMSLAPRLLLM